MEYVSLPLKVDDRGRLVRSDRTELLVSFIRALALTPRNSWPPDPEFGLKDEFEQRWRVGLPQAAVNALNNSLARFGWSDIKVASVKRTVMSEDWTTSSYLLTFVSGDQGNVEVELNLNSETVGR